MVKALQTEWFDRFAIQVSIEVVLLSTQIDPFEQRLRVRRNYPLVIQHMAIIKMLLRMGYTVGYRRVARLMKADNLSVNVKRACHTTQSVDCLSQWVSG